MGSKKLSPYGYVDSIQEYWKIVNGFPDFYIFNLWFAYYLEELRELYGYEENLLTSVI